MDLPFHAPPEQMKGTDAVPFIYLFIYLFIYFWLHWVFFAAHGLSLVAASGATPHCSERASHCVASLVAEHRL